LIASLAIVAVFVTAVPAQADEIPLPVGKVILEITGNIERFNDGDTLKIDLQMLEALPQTTILTDSPWTDEPTKFTGVRISELLDYIGAKSHNFRAIASDQYWNDLQEMDFDNIPAVLAYKRDDAYMRVRDLGPLWIMFPFDEFPELDSEKYKRACVWQLIGIEVH